MRLLVGFGASPACGWGSQRSTNVIYIFGWDCKVKQFHVRGKGTGRVSKQKQADG